ncbi:O-antigen ligase family protein [Paenarthrobacter nicotinovorans]|uniref:O-antigen ligase family protein n=1 Tax=Paenarthrobacter nicotinovorans TaxID=29320 RepID=UPI00381FF8CA
MNDALTYVGAGVAGLAVLCIWIRGWLFSSCIFATFLLIFSAGFAQTLFPLRFALLVFLILALVGLICDGALVLSHREKVFSISFAAVSGAAYVVGQTLLDPSQSDPLFRYTLLFPIAALTGWLLARSTKHLSVSRAYVSVSIAMGLLSVFERLSATFLVAGSYENAGRLIRDGSIRSIVFAEHPLVLSVLLICSLPFVPLAFKRRWLQMAAYATIIAGTVCTNSRGALVLVGIWILLRVVIRLGLLRSGVTRAVKASTAVVASIAFIGLMLGNGSDQLESSSALDASAEYRTALYTFAARSLIEQPFGWGISGLPEGTYMVASFFGTLDISNTVDSEVALTIFDFGWIGLLAFAVIAFGLVRPHRLSSHYGQAALLATASGLYLAIHAWVGLGSLWWLLLGLAFGAKKSEEQLLEQGQLKKTEVDLP